MLLPIITEPNPILHSKNAPLSAADLSLPKIQKLMTDMAETMYSADGVGIAAPQVGHSIQLCVIAKQYCPLLTKEGVRGWLPPEMDLILINPTWEKLSRAQQWDEEGCLSVPGIYGKVKRYKKIKVKALNRIGAPIEFVAEGFFARIVQHEVDHLNGVLFVEKAKNIHQVI